MAMAKNDEGLTPQELRFCEEYMVNSHCGEAAKRAGYSAKNARRIGARLLQNIYVVRKLDRMRIEMSMRCQINADAILKSLGQVVFFDPGDLFDSNGKLLAIPDMLDDVRSSIKSYTVTDLGPGKGVKTRIEFLDKLKAIEAAMKHLGISGVEEHKWHYTSDAQLNAEIQNVVLGMMQRNGLNSLPNSSRN